MNKKRQFSDVVFFLLPLVVTIEGVEPPKVLLFRVSFDFILRFIPVRLHEVCSVLLFFFCSFEGIFLTIPSNGGWVLLLLLLLFVYCSHRDATRSLRTHARLRVHTIHFAKQLLRKVNQWIRRTKFYFCVLFKVNNFVPNGIWWCRWWCSVELELELAKVERPKESETANGYYSLESLRKISVFQPRERDKKEQPTNNIDDQNNNKKSTE